MQEWTEEVLESNKTLFLCFSLCMFKLWLGQRAVLTIVEIEFLIYSILNFNKYKHFPFVLNFMLKIDFFAVTWAANE